MGTGGKLDIDLLLEDIVPVIMCSLSPKICRCMMEHIHAYVKTKLEYEHACILGRKFGILRKDADHLLYSMPRVRG